MQQGSGKLENASSIVKEGIGAGMRRAKDDILGVIAD